MSDFNSDSFSHYPAPVSPKPGVLPANIMPLLPETSAFVGELGITTAKFVRFGRLVVVGIETTHAQIIDSFEEAYPSDHLALQAGEQLLAARNGTEVLAHDAGLLDLYPAADGEITTATVCGVSSVFMRADEDGRDFTVSLVEAALPNSSFEVVKDWFKPRH